MIKLPRFTRSLPTFALSVLAAGALQAQTYNETGDAGTSVGTAQSTGNVSGNPLTAIAGTILSLMDGDFFYITITNPATFSATTVGGGSLDTMLYLFTANGSPVYLNDDDPGGASVGSTLPAMNGFGPMAMGTYIIGISLSGAEPINAGNQNLFDDAVFSTDIRGPRPGALGPVTGIRSGTFAGMGAYTIFLTGAATSAIPEPGTVALLAFSGLGVFLAARRRLRRS